MRGLLVALWAAVAVAGLAAGGLWLRAGGPDPDPVSLGGPFALLDHDGAPITQAAFEGDPSLLFFGFTHCPDICPTTVWEMDRWFEALGPEGDRLAAYFVTVDPARDTPEILRDYLTSQSDRVRGITGPVEAVHAMARDWKVYLREVPLDGGGYTMDHFAGVFMLDDRGRYAGIIGFGEPEAQVIPRLRALVRG